MSNMRVILIQIIMGVVGANSKVLEKLKELEIRGKMETINITALLRSTRKLRRVLET